MYLTPDDPLIAHYFDEQITGGVATCIGCGCDDYHACYDVKAGHSCYWLRLDRKSGLGVCSCCEDSVEAWDAGNREIKVAPTHG